MFCAKVWKELRAFTGDLSPIAKRKKHSQRSDSIKRPQFEHRLQNITDDNTGKSMRNIAKDLQSSMWYVMIFGTIYTWWAKGSSCLHTHKYNSCKTITEQVEISRNSLLLFSSDEKLQPGLKRQLQKWQMHSSFLCPISQMDLWVWIVKNTSCHPLNVADYTEVLETIVKIC